LNAGEAVSGVRLAGTVCLVLEWDRQQHIAQLLLSARMNPFGQVSLTCTASVLQHLVCSHPPAPPQIKYGQDPTAAANGRHLITKQAFLSCLSQQK
jgi:hypothetical protein